MRLKGKKERGILFPLASINTPYGIGDLGICAYDFIDFLSESGQDYWQILPLVPIDKYGSPYKSSCAFAGEILYIGLDFLVRDGLISQNDLKAYEYTERIDYKKVRNYKIPILKTAAKRFNTEDKEYLAFLKQNSFWIEDYALLSAALEKFKTMDFYGLPDGIKYRLKEDTEEFSVLNKSLINFYKITQFLFYRQYFDLKQYANKKGVSIIGDIPFYVAPDSVDVWANPQYFVLNRDLTPKEIAGVPPDIFSFTGQLWGNPIYDFEALEKDGYSWWINRLVFTKNMYDIIRIDHFRAFAEYYVIDQKEKTAENGYFKTGIGSILFDKAKKITGKLNIIAEDLGGEKDEKVQSLIKKTGFANMKVIQFAFDGEKDNPFLPENFEYNCVCYTGTHDNDTAMGFYDTTTVKQRIIADRILPYKSQLPFAHRMIRFAMESGAKLVIIPLQDYMCLGNVSRINTPGTNTGNWDYKLPENALNNELIKTVKELSKR